jgi:tetratricopeptide (TPR) repeat protein
MACSSKAAGIAVAVALTLQLGWPAGASAQPDKKPRASGQAARPKQELFPQQMELALAQGKYKEVIAQSRRALRAGSSRADAHYYLALGLHRSGKLDDALAAYQEAIQADANAPDPHVGLALCYEAIGKQQEALAAYRAYLERERREQQRIWNAAIKAVGKRVKYLGGELPPEYATLGRPSASKPAPAPGATAAKPQTPAGGCAAHAKAVKANPFDTAAYDRLVPCLHKAGRQQEIVARMRTALRDNPDYARGWLHLGQAQQALKQTSAARASFAKACELGVAEACSLAR